MSTHSIAATVQSHQGLRSQVAQATGSLGYSVSGMVSCLVLVIWLIGLPPMGATQAISGTATLSEVGDTSHDVPSDTGLLYPSLMWEITGPGLKKPSYLYGSMHVSRRVAFHLGDTFFMALRNVDVVALELNPAEWMAFYTYSDYYRRQLISHTNHLNRARYRQFYRDLFFPDLPQMQTFSRLLSKQHNVMNHLLYRKGDATADFEEMTYLDLFIYQAGVKLGKPVIGMEDFEESRRMVELAETPPPIRESSRRATRESSAAMYRLGETIEEAYRNGNLDLLDSLIRLSQPWDHYYTWMLVKRNEVMVEAIDSVIRSGSSIFAAAGAAHLPGDSGMIEMLRDKGYTLRPVTRHINRSQHRAKERIDNRYVRMPLKRWHAPDGDFSVRVPEKLYSNVRFADYGEYYYPDMVNGSFYVVHRFPSYAPLRGHGVDWVKARFDSLIYEFIPGTINRIREREVNGFPAYEIRSTLSRGDVQRYLIAFTPMEAMVFKMSGPGRYMRRHRNGIRFIRSVEINIGNQHEWTLEAPPQRGFSVMLPPYRMVDTTQIFERGIKDLVVQGYDFTDSSYYLMIKGSYHDLNYIEEDGFELRFMAEQLADQYDLELHDTVMHLVNGYPALSFSMFSEEQPWHYHARIVICGPDYYLLMTYNANDEKRDRFFGSFTITVPAFEEEMFYTYRDTTMFFTVETVVDPPVRQRTRRDYWSLPTEEVDNSHRREAINTTFFHYPSTGVIQVEYIRQNKYRGFNSLNEIWDLEMKRMNPDTAFVIRQHHQSDSGKVNTLFVELGDSMSSRTIHHKVIHFHGSVYRLAAVSDTINGPNPFVARFFNTFTPLLDTVPGWSVFDDKGDLFLHDLVSEDSVIRSQARQSLSVVSFHDHNAPLLMQRIAQPVWSEHPFAFRRSLILSLGSLQYDKVPEFLGEHYRKVGDTVTLQLAILRALARQKSEEAMKVLQQSMQHDLPLLHSPEDINVMFRILADSLETARLLYPGIFTHTRYREYEHNIYNLLLKLVDSNLVSNNIWANQYDRILRNARDHWRRHLAREEQEYDRQSEYYAGRTTRATYGGTYDSQLLTYLRLLLAGYYDQQEVQELVQQVLGSRTINLQTDLVLALLQKQHPVDDTLITALSSSMNSMALFYKKLHEEDLLSYIDESVINQMDFAHSLMAMEVNLQPARDTLEYLERHHVSIPRGDGYVYFFRRKGQNDRWWNLTWIGVFPADTTQVIIEDYIRNRSGSRIYDNDDLDELIELELKRIHVDGRRRASMVNFRRDATRYLWY